jgi:hypothetical protein
MSVANTLTLSDQANVDSRLDALEDQDVIFGSDLLQLESRVDDVDISMNLVETGQNIKMAQYYKTVSQNAPSGNTAVTWNAHSAWSDMTHITQAGGDSFHVDVSGLYYLEAHTSIDNVGGSWVANKIWLVNITRGSAQSVLVDTRQVQSGTNWGQSVTGIVELQYGDLIHIRISQILVSGTTSIRGQNGFDLNTFFTWRLIKTI